MIERDYFSDHVVAKKPYEFFEAMREQGPVFKPPGRDYFIVTGFDETLEVLRNHEVFSAVVALQGAGAPLPFEVDGSDITDQIEAHRKMFPGGDTLVNLDDEPHTRLRAFVNTLFVPSRLKASEEFIAAYSDNMVREAVAEGKIDLIDRIATPFVTVVVADLLGVPVADRRIFMEAIAKAPPPGSLDGHSAMEGPDHPFAVMGSYFTGYIMDRRANPQPDILTEFAQAKYADGTTPELLDLVQLGMFLFGAGQDTSAKLLGNAMKFILAEPGLQDRLRADPSLIPALLEEVLRLEGSTKQTARVARKDTTLAGIPIPAGTRLLVSLSAANRDPRRWENPDALVLNRPKIKEHVGFGRGKHVCAGAPLARVEVRVIFEKLLEHTSKIELDSDFHPGGVDDLEYEASFIIRGLSNMHLELTPAEGFIPPEKTDTAAAAEPHSSPSPIGDLAKVGGQDSPS